MDMYAIEYPDDHSTKDTIFTSGIRNIKLQLYFIRLSNY